MSVKSDERKHQILQALASMLENPRRIKITTAAVAAKAQISESALYRYFPNKSLMFEALIEFIEQTLFVLINKIMEDQDNGIKKIENILSLLLGFAQKNPGMTRILISDAIVNENECLQLRINQLHDRLEATLKQAMRFAVSESKINTELDVASHASLLMCYVIGSWHLFVKSEFRRAPIDNWHQQRDTLLPQAMC
ncbi:MAG: nucleoid occlusion factor SlmA [Betaproteobacteria bacterium]|nr:nucleoid occlusion factor SlmA [Betaproteobacteria bacterium]